MILITVSGKGDVRVQLIGESEVEEQEAARLYVRLAPAVSELRRVAGGRRRRIPVESTCLIGEEGL